MLTLPFSLKVLQETYSNYPDNILCVPVKLNNLSARAFTSRFNQGSNPYICHSRDSRKTHTQHAHLTTLGRQRALAIL